MGAGDGVFSERRGRKEGWDMISRVTYDFIIKIEETPCKTCR